MRLHRDGEYRNLSSKGFGMSALWECDFFIEKPYQKPQGCIVQTDDPADVPFGATIVPGTEFLFSQQSTAEIFGRKNQTHIGNASLPDAFMMQETKDRFQKGCTAINGEHPERGFPFQGKVSVAQCPQRCEEYFKAPADEATVQERFE